MIRGRRAARRIGCGLGGVTAAIMAAVVPALAQPGEATAKVEAALTPLRQNAGPQIVTAERLAALVRGLWPDAQKRGVSREVFERAFAGLEPDPDIFGLMASQPEHVTAPWDYLDRLASESRVASGRRLLQENAELLGRIEARYGVDRHIVLAVWGVESSFGASAGTRPVVRSLATLAAGDDRRPQFWRAELLAALTILQRADVTPERMLGSWAGAMGHTQFMPSSYLAHAVDMDGDGRRDIWGSSADALGSTANYLRASGWQPGDGWGAEVVLPVRFDFALSRPGVEKTPADWQDAGVTTPSGRPFPEFATRLSLVLPAGARGPAFLVSGSFKAILKYNNSISYALAVGHLADRIGGAAPVAGLWPTDDPPLGRRDREDLQRELARSGFSIGPADGVLGSGTRAAIRTFQQSQGLPEDGYASGRLLERLRSVATVRD